MPKCGESQERPQILPGIRLPNFPIGPCSLLDCFFSLVNQESFLIGTFFSSEQRKTQRSRCANVQIFNIPRLQTCFKRLFQGRYREANCHYNSKEARPIQCLRGVSIAVNVCEGSSCSCIVWPVKLTHTRP